MTREHWIKEFRQELNRLYTPARRLNALIQLYTPNACPNKDIIATLNAIANETADEGDGIIDISLLNSLYNLLALIPKQRPQNDDMKERSQLAEIQRSALNSIFRQVFNLKDISEMDDTETREALQDVANICRMLPIYASNTKFC